MWVIAIVWLTSAAIFLELADRAPTLEDSRPAKQPHSAGEHADLGAKVVQMSERQYGRGISSLALIEH